MESASSTVLKMDFDDGNRVLEKIQHFCEEDYLCDIILAAGEYSVGAHKVILAAYSDYFYALFSQNWKENLTNKVSLDLTEAGLRAIIEFVYNRRLTVNSKNISEVLAAVHHCQLIKAVDLCEMHLIQGIDQDNFSTLLGIAHLYALKDLMAELATFAVHEFVPTYTDAVTHPLNEATPKFMQSVFEKCIFAKNGYGVIAAFDVVMKWARANKQMDCLKDFATSLHSRGCDLDQVVKFCKLGLEERKNLSQDSPTCFVTSCVFSEMVVDDESYDEADDEIHETKQSFDLIAYSENVNSWKRLPLFPMDKMKRHSDRGTAVVLDNVLYVCSGILENSKNAGACHKYDPCLDKWVKLQSIPTPRRNFSLVGLGHKLYILGGEERTDNLDDVADRDDATIIIASVQIYDISSDQWSDGIPMPKATRAGAACVHGGKIFYSGGDLDVPPGLDDCLYCFDPVLQSWSKKADMRLERSSHGMVALGNFLYVLGGFGVDFTPSEAPVDAYNVSTDTWVCVQRVITRGPDLVQVRACCSFNDAVYAFFFISSPEHYLDESNSDFVPEDLPEYMCIGKVLPKSKRKDYPELCCALRHTSCDAELLLPLKLPAFMYKSFANFEPESIME